MVKFKTDHSYKLKFLKKLEKNLAELAHLVEQASCKR